MFDPIRQSLETQRERAILEVLREFRQSTLKRGQWRTEFNLEELAKVLGLDVLSTADLFESLVEEGYLRGHLLYKQQPSEDTDSDLGENDLVPYDHLSDVEKQSAKPAGGAIEALTEKGLVTIGELPDLGGQDSLSSHAGARAPEDTAGPAEAMEKNLSRLQDESIEPPGDGDDTKAFSRLVDALRREVAAFGEKAADPAPFKFAPVVGALAGFVGLLIPLTYPAGLIALWLQLIHEFGYGFWRALYAASLAPSAVVVGKITWIVLLSSCSALIPMWYWYAYARNKLRNGFRDAADLQESKRRVIRRFRWYAALLLPVAAILLFLAIMPNDFPSKPHVLEGKWSLGLLLGFLVLTVGQVLIGGAILFNRGIQLNDPETSRGPLYLGLAVVYVLSVAAGVCLAGLQYPYLPTTTLTFTQSNGGEEVKTTKLVGLLSNYSSHWYVVDYCAGDRFLAIPNKRVELDDARVDEPMIMENEDAKKECDTIPPKTTIESGPSGTVNTTGGEFVFSSNERRASFECSLDDRPYAPCTSPEDFSELSDGEHTFLVRATDAAGNTEGSPAERAWTVCYSSEGSLS